MSRTILEQLAVSKILAVQWQDMPCSTSTDSIDMFQKMRRGETIRKQYENLMSYLEVALKLQNRGQTHADKLALQRFVTFFETGVGTGELEPAMVYFQMVQDMYISETQTHAIDNGGPTTTAELEKLNRDNRDLKRQIQTLEAKAQSMNNGPGNSIKAAAVMENAFESYNKPCSNMSCGELILVNASFKERHKLCNRCHTNALSSTVSLIQIEFVVCRAYVPPIQLLGNVDILVLVVKRPPSNRKVHRVDESAAIWYIDWPRRLPHKLVV